MLRIVLVLILLLSGCVGSRTLKTAAGEQSVGQVVIGSDTMQYLVYLPKGYQDNEAWPLVLFLHGAGERGENLSLVTRHGPPKLAAAGRDFPFVLVAPQHPKGSWWDAETVLDFLDAVINKYRIDASRIYVTGLSMGGFGTWAIAGLAPERFAAVAPISGGGEPEEACRIHNVPVWAFHGTRDTVIPIERSREMVAALEACGAEEVRFTEYPDAGHDAWTRTYADSAIYQWLLSHSR